jgi:hypothetical protein
LASAAWRVWLRALLRLRRAVVFDGVVVVLRADVLLRVLLLRAVDRLVLGLRAVLEVVLLVFVVSAMRVPPCPEVLSSKPVFVSGVPSYICSYTRTGWGLQRQSKFVAHAGATSVNRP